jgi:hypothetical protein
VTTSSVERIDGSTTYFSGPATGVPYPAGALVAVTPGTPGDLVFDATTGFGGTRILDRGDADLLATFQANVRVGDFGSGKEEPFRAARLALSDRLRDANAGFLRPGARLAVIFLTDEDDCSGPPDQAIWNDAACGVARNAPSSSLVAVSDFAAFLQGPIAGEVRDVVVAAITGVTCVGGVCTKTDAPCGTARDIPDRIVSLLALFSPARTRLASICDPSFDQALDEFAGAIMSQTLPLDGAVADYRMLVAKVTKPGVGTIGCRIASASAPAGERNLADAIYEPPQSGRSASLTFQNACALDQGDSVDVNVVCVR